MSMKWYVARRLAWAVFATWVALSLTWALFTVSPVGGELRAAQQAAQTGGDPEEAIEDYKKQRGTDVPLWEQYVKFVLNMFVLNWGWSVAFDKPVTDVLLDAWPYTFQYIGPSVALSALAGYGLGLYSAMRKNTRTDYLATMVGFFGLSIPNFWFAIVLILVTGVWLQDATLLGVELGWFKLPTFYNSSVVTAAEGGILGYNLIDPDSGFEYGWVSLKNLRQILLPIVVVSTASFASQMRFSRAQALEVVNQEFVKTARSKGATERRVWLRHVFRVALVPLSTLLINDILAFLIAGSLVIEQIFAIPGISLLYFKALTTRPDTALVMAVSVLFILIAIVGYLLQDLAYVALDPRIDYGER